MDRSSFESWLDAYGRAWEACNPEAAAALYTSDATYQVTRFIEPPRGCAVILDYWSHIDETEQEVLFLTISFSAYRLVESRRSRCLVKRLAGALLIVGIFVSTALAQLEGQP